MNPRLLRREEGEDDNAEPKRDVSMECAYVCVHLHVPLCGGLHRLRLHLCSGMDWLEGVMVTPKRFVKSVGSLEYMGVIVQNGEIFGR